MLPSETQPGRRTLDGSRGRLETEVHVRQKLEDLPSIIISCNSQQAGDIAGERIFVGQLGRDLRDFFETCGEQSLVACDEFLGQFLAWAESCNLRFDVLFRLKPGKPNHFPREIENLSWTAHIQNEDLAKFRQGAGAED